MIICTTKRFNYRFKIQPKFSHRINQILNLYKKNDGKQKVLRGALIKRRDFLWIWKMLFQCRKKESCLPNKTFLWSGKITYEEAFKSLLKSYLLFAGSLEILMQQKGETTEEEGGGFWKSLGIFHAWESYGNCWIHLGEYWKTTGMQSLCTD